MLKPLVAGAVGWCADVDVIDAEFKRLRVIPPNVLMGDRHTIKTGLLPGNVTKGPVFDQMMRDGDGTGYFQRRVLLA